MVVPRSLISELTRLRCVLTETAYNPKGLRTGAKYLRARLRGPSIAAYYPPTLNLSRIARRYPQLEIVDEEEQERVQDVLARKKRGKGAPKKAKTKEESTRLNKKR